MAYQVSWSPEAIEDVQEIAAYIERDSPFYAQAVVEQLVSASRALNQMPLRGRIVPELENETYRENFIYSYRMIYKVDAQEILIIAVIHGRRLLSSIEERFEK